MLSIYALCSVAEMQAGDRSVTSQSEPGRYRQNRMGKKGCINGRCSQHSAGQEHIGSIHRNPGQSPGRRKAGLGRALGEKKSKAEA